MKDIITIIMEDDAIPSVDLEAIKQLIDDAVANLPKGEEPPEMFIHGNSSANPFIFSKNKTGIYIFLSANKLPDQNLFARATESNTVNYSTSSMRHGTLYYYKDINEAENNEYIAMFVDQTTLQMTIIRKSTVASGLSVNNFDVSFVNTITQQDITGRKTFTDPRVRTDYILDNDFKLAHKKYVDEKIASSSNDADNEILVFNWDGRNSTTNPENINLFQEIYNKFFIEKKPVMILTSGTWSSHGISFNNTPAMLVPIRTSATQIIFRGSPIYTDTSSQSMTYNYLASASMNFNANGEVTSVGAVGFSLQQLPTSAQVCFRWNATGGGGTGTGETALTLNNAKEYNPTLPFNPATKKYVDDAIAALRAELGGS